MPKSDGTATAIVPSEMVVTLVVVAPEFPEEDAEADVEPLVVDVVFVVDEVDVVVEENKLVEDEIRFV